MRWEVLIGDEFEPEFEALHVDVQNEILALAILLRQFGHNWDGRGWTR